MGVFARIPPLLVVALALACTSPSTGATEDRPGNAAATLTSSPSVAGVGTGAEGSAGVGADGQHGQDGRSARGDGSDGKDTGTPPTSSRGRNGSSFAVTNNDVLIGANFVGEHRPRVSFDSTSPGSPTTRAVVVGSRDEVTVTSVSLSSGTAVFRIEDDGCTGTRLSETSCRVTVIATPPAEGDHEGTLEIDYTTGSTLTISVTLKVAGEGGNAGLAGSAEETADEDSAEETADEESARPDEPPTTPG